MKKSRTNGRDVTANDQGSIRSLVSGVPGLDVVLGGGLPEYSFNLIAGGPGAGKTTLAQQIIFTNASKERPALYFTVLGEPTIKMLRYQQRYEFFDPAMVGSAVQYLHPSEEALDGDVSSLRVPVSLTIAVSLTVAVTLLWGVYPAAVTHFTDTVHLALGR